jgi:hypothetical protein
MDVSVGITGVFLQVNVPSLRIIRHLAILRANRRLKQGFRVCIYVNWVVFVGRKLRKCIAQSGFA